MSEPGPNVVYVEMKPRDYTPMGELMAGVMVGGAAMIGANKFLPAGDRWNESKDLDGKIVVIQHDQETLRDSQKMLQNSGDASSAQGVETLINTKDQQIAEIRTQKEEVGYDTMDSVETLWLPLALGVLAAAYTFKRIHRSS